LRLGCRDRRLGRFGDVGRSNHLDRHGGQEHGDKVSTLDLPPS
jgi:hypothetical protein